MIETTAPTIERALLALSGLDTDGARIQNGVGFNQRDTGFGNSLAQQIKSGKVLSERQAFAAHRMLATYTQQLANMGIDYGAIPPPTTPAPKASERVIEVVTDTFIVKFPYSQELVTAIKMLPDRARWEPDKRFWVVPNTEDNIVGLAAIVKRYGFTLTPEATTLLKQADALSEAQEAYARELIEQSNAAAADLEIEGLGGVLRPFQKAGVKYAMRQRRTFIADEMGLGKTVQGLATVHGLGAYPAIVVCPASLKENWRREAVKWCPGKRVTVLKGRAKYEDTSANLLFAGSASTADILIVNYDVLGSWAESLRARGPKAVIFDESHYIKTQGALRTKASRALAQGIATVLMLTGTPVLNRPKELLAQLTVMDRLRELGGPAFRRQYIDAWEPDLHELNDKLRALCYIRRTKAQVIAELPPKQRTVVPIELDNMDEYLASEGELVAFLIREDPDKARVARLAEDLAHIEALKQLVANGKLAGAVEWIEDFLESGEKLIVFAWHRSIVEKLAERFNAPKIYGGMSDDAKQAIVDSFQTDPKVRLVIGNMQAMGIGHTMTAASNVAFLELGWTPAVHDQAEDRVYARLNDMHGANAWYLLAPLTIDERIQRLIDAKRIVVNATTDGRMAPEEQSVLSDLIADLTAGRSAAA